MGVFSRLTDIFNSNINALLDKAEDPEKMIRLMIHEMEETLVEVRSDLAGVIAQRKSVQSDRERYFRLAEDWEAKAELAIKKSREDLAKGALVEKNKALRQVELVDDELATLETTLTKFQDDIVKLQQKIDEAKARQKAILMRARTAESRLSVKKQLERSKSNDVTLKFDRFERRLNDLESQVDAYDYEQRSLADQIEELEAEESIDKELAALKARMNKSADDEA